MNYSKLLLNNCKFDADCSAVMSITAELELMASGTFSLGHKKFTYIIIIKLLRQYI